MKNNPCSRMQHENACKVSSGSPSSDTWCGHRRGVLLHGNDGPPMIAVGAVRKVESDAYSFRLIRQHSSPS